MARLSLSEMSAGFTAEPRLGGSAMRNVKPSAIFFDLDDTIIDDSSGVDSGWRRALLENTAGINADLDALVARVHGVRDWYWSDPERHRVGRQDLRASSAWIVGEALSRLEIADPERATRIAHRYRDVREEDRTLLPGAVETLEQVRALGIKTALLTNGAATAQRAKLTRFNLERQFDFIGIEGEFGYGKPDERVYQAALAALGVAPAETWMVGDNLEWDVAAPMRIGLTGIWLDRFRKGLPEAGAVQPDRVVTSIGELLLP